MNNYLRKDLQTILPYSTKVPPCQFKLDANESSFPIPKIVEDQLKKVVLSALSLNHYPDGEATNLRESISTYYQISKESILCGNGSDEIIQMISLAFLEPEDSFLWPTPSFSMYEVYGKYAHGKSIALPLTEDFQYNLKQWLTTIDTVRPKIIYLCTPNNPTGTLLDQDFLQQVIEHAPGLIVIDGAYGEFAQQELSQWILQFPNVILLKTLSKAFSFAGVRLGYCIAQQSLINQLAVVKGPYNLNALTQQIGSIVFQHMNSFQPIIEQWIDLREQLYQQLIKFPEVTVYPSHGNFLLVRFPDSQFIFEQLLSKGILVRRYSQSSVLSDWLRITVGTKEANQQIINVLSSCLSKEGHNG